MIERGKKPPALEPLEQYLIETWIVGRLAQLDRRAAVGRNMKDDNGDGVETMLTQRFGDLRHRLEDGARAAQSATGRWRDGTGSGRT